jgi:MFS superfamily sulfate permease-like transporter
LAGLSLAAFVIPESIAYASLAQLPPVTGLYCYLVAGIVYALLGTSRQIAVGPTSALAIVIASGVAAMGGEDPARAVALASAIALMVGIICVAGRFVGLANAAYFISDPVLIGFKTGAALYIASTQLPKLFGVEGVTGNFFERVSHIVVSLPESHVPSLLFGLAAIVLFMVFERLLPGRPTTLIVVVAAIAVMTVFGLSEVGIKIVGDLPSGLPENQPAEHSCCRYLSADPGGAGVLRARLWRDDLGRTQLCAKIRLRDQPGAGAHGARRRQHCHGNGPRFCGRGRNVADRRQ